MLGFGWCQAIYNSCSVTTYVLQIRRRETDEDGVAVVEARQHKGRYPSAQSVPARQDKGPPGQKCIIALSLSIIYRLVGRLGFKSKG